MKKSDYWTIVRETLTLLAVAMLAALIAGFFLLAPMRTQEFWIGDKGWLEVVTPVGTLIAALVAAGLAFMTYQANRREGIDARFQKAVELLSNDQEVTRAGGVFVLRDIIVADPERYYLTAIDLLCVFVSEQCSPVLKAYEAGEAEEDQFGEAIYSPPVTPADVHAALMVIGTVRTPARVEEFESVRTGMHRFAIDALLLHEVSLIDLNLSFINLSNTVYGRTHFYRCNLDGAHVRFLPTTASSTGDDLTLAFDDCGLRRAHVSRASNDYAFEPKILFNECDLTESRVYLARVDLWIMASLVQGTNIPFTSPRFVGCWFFVAPPQVKEDHAESIPPFAAGFGRPFRLTRRGLQLYLHD